MFDKKVDNSKENAAKALKDAFENVKKDIFTLGKEMSELKIEIKEIKSLVNYLDDSINNLRLDQINSTHNLHTSTHAVTSTNTSTVPHEIQGSKYPNLHISSGNGGASTDRQTHQQTQKTPKISENTPENSIDNAAKILDSLDSLKKDIRLKFKKLTEQELLIFSTLYQLDEEKGYSDYKTVADRINLTESSVRDYIGRLIKKGIPVDKTRINNKTIHLSISPNLKKVASLPTILQLRDL